MTCSVNTFGLALEQPGDWLPRLMIVSFIDRTPLIDLLPLIFLGDIMSNTNVPITPNLIVNWQEAHAKASKFEDQIIDRIDYILNTWFEVFGSKLDYWYFDGADEGEVGNLSRYFDNNSISGFYVEVNKCPNEMIIIDKDGHEWGWESEIPTRWLFEDGVKEEIVNGKAEYERRERERKEKKKQSAANRKAKDEQLAAEAMKKLSKEELAALKRAL